MDDSLEIVTGKINAIWQKTDDYQATLGQLMVRAKMLVDAGDPFAEGLKWSTYAQIHFPKANGEGRSARSIRMLLQIGAAPEPEAKAKEIRGKDAERKRKKRQDILPPSRKGGFPTECAGCDLLSLDPRPGPSENQGRSIALSPIPPPHR